MTTPDVTPASDPVDVEAVLELLRAVSDADGVAPLSEQAFLRLRHRHAAVELAASVDDEHVGYLQLDPEAAGKATAELTVHPTYRRRGHGASLIERALELVPGRHLAIWAHGDTAAAAGLAEKTGFSRERLLYRMQRTLADVPAVPPLPDGVRLRTFQPGRDDEDWVAINRRAFAAHPEQSRVTVDDLHERMEEPWFDPDGFFLAERADDERSRLVGFHWTKRHPPTSADGAPIGEVYVLGVDPSEQGSGLGKVLTLAGLTHLSDAGLHDVILYADKSNASAVSMYERLGFEHESTDVLYAR